MNTNFLDKLEFNKILDILSTFCCTYLGKNLVTNLSPSNNELVVNDLLEETFEAINLSFRNSFPSFYNISDISIELKSLKSNMILSAKSLLSLANVFKLANELKVFFAKDFLDVNDYPILSNFFNELYSNTDIIDKIFSCILDESTIDDRASKKLYSIRKQQRKLEQDIRSNLNQMIHSSSFSKYIQENIVTIRNNRFVIPVKEEYRSQIKGFVHDVSNAGSTVFIEPISVFEMNNEINQLKVEENIEIEMILRDLTMLFYPYVDELELDLSVIGKLDFIFAKAKYAKSINAIIPNVNSKKEIDLVNARHPLLDIDKAVPISLNLGDDFSVLLITGPNTGGKTVTLKTVGLLTCMACSGLAIPCAENSSIHVFDYIFADIGDDQSISDSLSTFSSHMLNIVEITKNVTNNSLVLVDELGSGTDPLEGANLAISILDYLKNIDCLTIATTHYQELKQYALVTKGFENASVEFDISTLSPTYKLLIGIPGKSNAFEISKKLGLDLDIINKAKSLLTSDQINIEELLKNIYDDKSIIENEKQLIQEELEKVSNLRKLLEKDNSDLLMKKQNLINDAKIKARNILLDAKEDASEIIKQMNTLSSSSNISKLDNLRNELNSKIKTLKPSVSNENSISNPLSPDEINPNMEVFVTTLNQKGIVLSHVSKSNEVQVQVGSIKTNINIKYLTRSSNHTNSSDKKINSNSNSNYTSISKSKNIKTEINVIGLNIEEALFVVDKFLDDCSLAKLQTVRVVHGKGTGKLRTAIQQFLKTHPHVKSYRIGTYGEGEMGVTVVELK